MPMFDFKCENCDTVTEKIVPSGTTKIECPKCHSLATRQLSAPGGFELRGEGFYKPSA